MTLQDPFAAYNAANPYEASVLCQALNDAGIPAQVIDDVSQAGAWLGGLVPELNKTQIWISREQAEQARVVLEEYERRTAELSQVQTQADAGLPPINVTCDACGHVSQFGAHLRGSVQTCEECGAYLDVGESNGDTEEWAVSEEVDDASDTGESDTGNRVSNDE